MHDYDIDNVSECRWKCSRRGSVLPNVELCTVVVRARCAINMAGATHNDEASGRAGNVCAGVGITARQRGTGGSESSSPDSRDGAHTADMMTFSFDGLQTLTFGASYPSSCGACHHM